MVWPLLLELGVGLLKQDANNREIEEQRQRAIAQGRMDIMNRRAQRAGDSGYIQSALSAAQSFPTNPDNGAGILASVGVGLLKQQAASNEEDSAREARESERRGPVDDGSIGGGQMTAAPDFDNEIWNDPRRRSPGLIGRGW